MIYSSVRIGDEAVAQMKQLNKISKCLSDEASNEAVFVVVIVGLCVYLRRRKTSTLSPDMQGHVQVFYILQHKPYIC